MCNVTFGLADQTNLALVSFGPVFSKKLVGVRFSQLHGANICIGFVSPVLLTKYVCLFSRPCIVPFDRDWLAGDTWLTFPSAPWPQIRFCLAIANIWVSFPPAQTLTWVYFPSAQFLLKILRLVSLFLMAPIYIYIYRICFPWPSGPKQILTWVYFPWA